MEAHRIVRTGAEAETVDVGELARTVGRGWRTVLVGGLGGLLLGVGLVLFFPARWPGDSTVLVRNANDPTGSLLSRFNLPGDIGSGGGALGNVLKSPLETELQILGSRDVLGEVVDSLGLQARVLAPRGRPSRTLVRPGVYAGSFKRKTFAFARRADGAYDVSGADTVVVARPGVPATLPVVGPVTLASGELPAKFRVQFEDRDDAITRLSDRLDVEKKGGEVVELEYSGPDSVTAAEVPNAVFQAYLLRRRTVDRGLNQRRYEFLTLQADSVGGQLASAENALRRQQERTGVFDPELSGKAGVEGLQALREQLSELQGEQIALRQVLTQVDQGRLTARQLAAFPSFLRSPAINAILQQMSALETDRTKLLERRTERDPEVVAITRSIDDLEKQLLPIGRAYSLSLDRQVGELERQQRGIEAQMAALPGQAEGNLARQRDVKRLTQTLLALQAQILDARLAAIGEGGQVRQIDVATPPKKPLFPRPLPTLVVAAVLGLIGGAVWAVARGAVTSIVRTPTDAERATGLPALAWTPGRPLLLGPGARGGTLVVVPIGSARDAAIAARQCAEHARERGQSVALIDLDADAAARAPGGAVRLVADAEAAHALVVVAVPPIEDARTAALLEPPRTAVLVAREGHVRRHALADAVTTLSRLAVPCLGVVLADRDGAAVVGVSSVGRPAIGTATVDAAPPVLRSPAAATDRGTA